MKKRGILFVVILGVFLCFLGSYYEVEVLDEENKRLSARETLRYLFDNLYTADDKSTMEELEVCDTQEALYYKYKFKRSTGEISDPYILYYMYTTEDEKYHKFELYREIWDNIYREEGITREYARNSHSNYWYIDTKSKEIIPQWIYNPDAEDDASYCTYNEKYYEIDKTYDGGEFRNSENMEKEFDENIASGEREKLAEQIKRGDFSDTKDSDLVDTTELEEVYKNISQNTEWLRVDLNGDSIRDLIWLEYAENIPRIVGIFDMNDKGKCVYWDIMDYTEFFFIADNKQLVRYSQYFGFYDYVSYEQYNYNKNWDKNILEGAYAYNLYEVEIPYWLDEHNHDDMKEVGIYFKGFRNGIEMSIEKNDFQILYEKITGNDYRDIQKNSDLFWLY